jgi:VWFA-related protein
VAIKAQSSGHPFALKTNGHEELQSSVNRRGSTLHQAVGTDGLLPTRTKRKSGRLRPTRMHLVRNECIALISSLDHRSLDRRQLFGLVRCLPNRNFRIAGDSTRLLNLPARKTGSGRKPSVFTGGSHAWLCLCIASRTRCNPGGRCAGYARRETPRARGIVVSRSNPQRTAFLASMIVLGTCGAGGQTPPLRDQPVAQKPFPLLSATDPVVRDGLFSIDLVVADSAGNPVSDLPPWDFILLDNGQPAKIRTVRKSREPFVPTPELIFVLDAINLSPQQLTQTESAIVHFLRRNSGRQETACFLYRLTRDGLFSSWKPTRDGNLLAKEVEQHKSPRTVWRSVRNDGPNLLRAWVDRSQPNPLSLRALGSIAVDQREIAGRKVVVWISPGWPVNGGDIGFDEATELSTRLREARITLDNVNVWPNPDQSFNYHDYLEAPRSQKDMQPAKLTLQVIATHTGGLVLDSSGDLDRDIERCVEEVRSFYILTFNPRTPTRWTNSTTSVCRWIVLP